MPQLLNVTKILNKIFAAAQTLAGLWARQRTHFETEQSEKEHFDFKKKLETIFWEGLSEDDPINPELDKCVKNIEVLCRNILADKSTLKKLRLIRDLRT